MNNFPKSVLIYNTGDGDNRTWQGDEDCTVILSVWGDFDFETQTYPNIKQEIPLGVITPIEWISAWDNISSCYLECKALNGKSFGEFRIDFDNSSPFEMPRNEIESEFTSEAITYLSATGSSFLLKLGSDVVPDVESISNNYLLSKDELSVFKTEIYNIVKGENALNPDSPSRTDNFISSFKIYPFKIDPSNFSEVGAKIKISTFTLDSLATELYKDSISLNLGTISIPKIHDNSLDFIDVECDLYLPFLSSSIAIDPSLIIGSSVEIQCNLSIESGSITINLKNLDKNEIYNISTSVIGADYPFLKPSDMNPIQLTPNQVINDIRQAYIITKTPNYEQTNPLATRKGILLGQSGYVEIQSIELMCEATTDEKNQIISSLKNGVIIK